MLCKFCGKDRDSKDFYHENICYKCDVENKRNCTVQIEIKKVISCKECGKNIPKQRSVYCSNACYRKNLLERSKNAWFLQIKIEKKDWRNWN